MTISRLLGPSLLALLGASILGAQQQDCPALHTKDLPLKYKGGPTVPAISACDLMTRLYIFSDDSMMGRRVATPDNLRGTAYIEGEVRKLGLKPGGDNGGYFQYLDVVERRVDSTSTLTVGGKAFHYGDDFTFAAQANHSLTGAQTVYGGIANDTTNVLSPDAVRGKVLILGAAGGGAFGGRGGRGGRGPASPAMQAYNDMESAAALVLTVNGGGGGRGGRGGRGGGGGAARGGPTGTYIDSVQINGQRAAGIGGRGAGAPTVAVQSQVVEAIFGKPVDLLTKGATGASVSANIKVIEKPLPTRNVVAILPGSDPKLRGEYVAIGAHNDHNGYTIGGAVDHDSLRAFNSIDRPLGADTRNPHQLTPEEWVRVNAMKDSLHALHHGTRPDSIQNGADDDGSGSVSALEIAEAFAKLPTKPKRSIIFVWHTGEESGLWGSQWFTNHPSVPRDSIVAQLNMDMVGRGEPGTAAGLTKDSVMHYGSDNYLQLVGSRRLSTELGDIVEQVNKTEKVPFDFDYALDADGHPSRIYCRSDHYNYARYGIPITFFTTGLHEDYHQNTDEAEYIQYQHMARVDQLIYDIAMKVADLDHRPVVDKQKPASPYAACVQ